ncbi:C40 family peptidase [Streptomyces sp. NPDC012769]|uniref:C40 family peptidase n=1 Tax=Streptomyces sp. NPDC012769 TaxID=3364848 RepID=UPI00369E23AF
MAVDEFIQTYRNSLLNKKIINPLSGRSTNLARPELGINSKPAQVSVTPGYGSSVSDWISGRKSTAINAYMQDKNERTGKLASDYASKAAGQIPVDEYGIVQDKTSDFSDFFNRSIQTTSEKGKFALATEEAKSNWQHLQGLREQSAGYEVNYTPGATAGNRGAQAVNLAMQAYKNKTPYVWGGNSLTRGVDCSGLIQQVYRQLGINLPRTTYDQAKQGKRVPVSNLLPGDLVFYNTGSQDPNGIGSLSHVAIYIGNGQIIDARNSRAGIKLGNINIMGGPVAAVRPW